MNYNSIGFKTGLAIFISQDECDAINASLLAGDRFVQLPRIQQTFNIDTISSLGINDLFRDPKVIGSDFRFNSNSVVAKKGDKEFIFQGQGGWKPTREQFDKAMTFEELLISQTV